MAQQHTPPSFLVSTDLDGTLLDHHTYSWQAATDAIHVLQEQNIPIIFNTSKTFQEAYELQQQVGITGPLIIENGSALALPKAMWEALNSSEQQISETIDDFVLITFGSAREDILDFIRQQKEKHGAILEGYNDWNLEIIAEKTGLTLEGAKSSSTKKYSEPFIWLSDESTFDDFHNDAKAANLKILKGGRFYHLQGDTDKAKPLLWLQQQYSTLNNSETKDSNSNTTHSKTTTVPLICLGDNKNDIDMLNIANYPVCVKSPTSPYPEITPKAAAIYTQHYGPEGWHEAIMMILEKHGSH